MKKLITILSILFLVLSINAQEIISLKESIRLNGFLTNPICFHGDYRFTESNSSFPYVPNGSISVYKEGKFIINHNLNTASETGINKVRDYIFKDDYFVTFNIFQKEEKLSVFIQLFDYEFNQIGEPIQIIETTSDLGNTLSEKELKKSYTKIRLKAHYNEESQTTLVKLHVHNSEKPPYLALFKLDQDFTVKSSYAIQASEKENTINILAQSVLPNGEVFAIIGESSKVDAYSRSLIGYNLIHLSDDNEHEYIEVAPDGNKLISSHISSNTADNKVIVSILTTDNEVEAKLAVYEYNLKTKGISKNNYNLNGEELFTETDNLINKMSISKVQYLSDGSSLFIMNHSGIHYGEGVATSFYDQNMLVLNVDTNKELAWVNPIPRNCRSHAKSNLSRSIDYLTEDGYLEIIFNTRSKDFKKGYYKTKKSGILFMMKNKKETIPVKAKINLYNGEMEIKQILKNEEINSISYESAQEMDEIGVYKLVLNKRGEPFVGVIDFKDN